jgi:hypothetical protein
MMDRLSSFLLRHLRHVQRKKIRRLAVRNGLLSMTTTVIDGHVVGCYRPLFDPRHLAGDVERDRQWLQDNLAAFLVEPPSDTATLSGQLDVTPDWPVQIRRGGTAVAVEASTAAYAVRMVAKAGDVPNLKHMATVLLLAVALQGSHVSVRDLVMHLRQPASVFSVGVPVEGFERSFTRLIEETDFVPFGPYVGMAANFAFVDDLWRWVGGETKRVFLQVPAERPSRSSMREQILWALAHAIPVLGLTETASGVPEQINLTCDVRITGSELDGRLITGILEAVFGREVATRDNSATAEIDAGALTLDDLAIAIRPGRSFQACLDALVGLATLNREQESDEDGNRKGDGAPKRRIASQSSSQLRDKLDGKAGEDASSSQGRRKQGADRRPTEVEVIHPECVGETANAAQPSLRVETLTGYGPAQDWALGLRQDLADYHAKTLAWSQMSTKLLLSGPPGTGKTIFARALCNTLQVPLVVTSVSTWLQGEYLHDVLNRMADTFAQARSQAPCILFIDEIDGIGSRVSTSREYGDYWNACVNKMLELLDGTVKSEGVVIVGATNRPDAIDEALRRSGRLETHITIPKPDIPSLVGILAHHLGDDLDTIANYVRPSADEVQ